MSDQAQFIYDSQNNQVFYKQSTLGKAFLENKKRSRVTLSIIPIFIFSYLTKYHWFDLLYKILGNKCIDWAIYAL